MPNIILEGKKIKLTVLEHLKERGEIKSTIEARLNDTLKANLSIHLREQPESRLAAMIAEIAPRDLNAIKDLTLKKFVEQTIEAKIGDDENLRNEYEEFLETLTDETRINDLLYLDQPLEKNPLFEDIVKDSQLHQLLQLTPLKNKPDKTDAFLSALDQSGGLHDGFWEILEKDKVASNKEIEDIKLTFELSALALDNLELVKALKERNIKAKEDLIPFRKEEWLHIFEEHNITPPDSFEDENRLEAYANYLSDYIADESSTAVFFNRLLSDNVDEYIEDLICVKEFLRLNPDVALETEISYEKVIWPSDDPQERENIKQSIENLRKLFKLYSQLGLERIINNAEIKPEAKMQEINDEIAKLGIFYQNNPRLDLHYADFYNGYATTQVETGDEMPEISWDGLEERDKDKLTNQLKVYQRLFRIRPRFKTTKTLLKNDFDSARNITLIPKEQFVAKYADLLSNPDTTIAEQVYDKALAITENTTLQWANVKDAIASPYYTGTFFNNVDDTLKKEYQSLRSYQDMFGSLNFCECEHCKSIFGPAAYFVDLMRFIDLHITESKQNQIPQHLALKERRPDLWQIPLDCENTNTLISYLDIVNDVLEKRLAATGKDPYEVLLIKAKHPFNLPFNLPLAQIRIYLEHFKKDLSEIYEVFDVSDEMVAREYLRISNEELSLLTTSVSNQNDLAPFYGIGAGSLLSAASGGLARVKTFLYHTDISRKELNELLFQNLDQTEKDDSEQDNFFINNVNEGKDSLKIEYDTGTDQDGKKIKFERILNLSNEKLDRIHRFVRLSRKLDWSSEDLDWVLRSIGKTGPGANLDNKAIIKIARIKKWKDKYNLPLDVLCCFWSDIKNIGQDNPKGEDPQDLFNRVFNNPDVLMGETRYDFSPLRKLYLDKSSNENRNWLLAALEIYDDELDLVIEKYLKAVAPAPTYLDLNYQNLGRLYRFSKIPKAFGITIKEFTLILELMEKSEIKSIDDFEALTKIVDWITASGFSVYELHYFVTGALNEYVDPGYTDTDIRSLIEDLSKELKNAIVKASTFMVIEGVDEETSKEIFAELKKKKFLEDVEIGGRLTDKFKPNDPNLNLGLSTTNPPLDAYENQVIEILKQYLKTEIVKKSAFMAIDGIDKEKSEKIYSKLKENKFLQAIKISGRLTDNFEPAKQNFSLGLTPPLDTYENQVINVLKLYEEEKIVLEKLGLFFATDPGLLKSVIYFVSKTFASKTIENTAFLELLFTTIEKENKIPDKIIEFLSSIHLRLLLVKKLKLNKSEVESVISNPGYYDISKIDDLKIKDIKSLHSFKQLILEYNDTTNALIQYFNIKVKNDEPQNRRKKAKILGDLTYWEKVEDTAESWDKSHFKILFDRFWPGSDTGYNTVQGILKLKKCFDVSSYLGVGIDILLDKWLKTAKGNWTDYADAAKSVLEILKAKYDEDEWEKKYEPINDKIRELKRDALSSYAVWNIDKSIKDLRDLYEYQLIDVEMSCCADISKIKQAISSLQLYIQRCQMNLESGITPESIPEKQWSWRKNYRVWEANRKVFLYPENYIEPELRDNKSPIFKELEDELLQAEVTEESVEKAYKNYLDKFSELANLKIAGSYHDTATDTLYLFGRTNTEPYTYYYRTYRNEKTWTPWVKVNLSIKPKYVSPIYAFNKLFIFWVEVTARQETKIKNGSASDPTEYHLSTIKYSFYNFNKNWAQPQTLYENIPADYTPYKERTYPVKGQDDSGKSRIIIKCGFGGYLYSRNIKLYYNLSLADHKPHMEKRILYSLITYKNELLPIEINDWIDTTNYYNEADYPPGYSKLHPRPYTKKAHILAKISEFATIKIVNNSSIPYWFILDNVDEEFLIKKRGWCVSVVSMIESEGYHFCGESFYFQRMSTNPVHKLSEGLFTGGVDSLLSIESQNLEELDFNDLKPNMVKTSGISLVHPPYSGKQLDFEGAYGLYYREIFFHIPFLIANRLNANQKFKEAQKWYHSIFNPTISKPEKEKPKNPKDVWWRYLPFRDLNIKKLNEILSNAATLDEYHNNPFKPHAIARLRLTAYHKAIVMKYIDNLLDWGDYLFAQDTWESITEATMLYVLAYDLLGPQPEKLDVCKSSGPANYNYIETMYKDGKAIPEFLIDLENTPGAACAGSGTANLNNDISAYFCVPENKDLIDYWDRVEDRLYKIRYCMSIKGVVRKLALFQPPISPMALVRAFAAGRDISSVLSEMARSLPYYRFTFMLEKARSFTATVQQLGPALLSALEKKDAKEISLMRSTHEKNIQKLMTTVREKQRDEAIESHAALLESKNSAKTRNKRYEAFMNKSLPESLSGYEQSHLASMETAWYFDLASNILRAAASIGYASPQAGSPLALTYGGKQIGASLTAASEVLKILSSYHNLQSSMSSTMGSYERRRNDWELQRDLAQHDIDQIERQIKAAELRKLIAETEIDIHKKTMEQTDEVYNFLKDKFTSKDLYQWMANQLSGLYFQTYKMAYDLAKSAEKAYQYERNTDDTYINFGHWDSLKKGLLAGERLMLELNQLEKAYIEDNARPFEIEKTISLAQINPTALIALKKKGSCEFELSEELFDCDFPGHYCRKIKTIYISVPAVVGPYENVKATLTEEWHKTLIKADTSALSSNSVKLDSESINVRSGWMKNQQIAISRGVNDSGMFELNFRDERYLPFEGTGAVSGWKLEMPKASNQFDFDSISDVIINLKYTALFDGGLKKKVQSIITGIGGYRILSLRHEFSTAWHQFVNPTTGKKEHELKFAISEKLLPPNAKDYQITEIHMKIDSVPLGGKLNISLTPAGQNNEFLFSFNKNDIANKNGLTLKDFSGGWVIKINRKINGNANIPKNIRKKKNGSDEVEVIGNDKYCYLDPEKFKNIGLILVYEGSIDWPKEGS